jgi:hypothetical protein
MTKKNKIKKKICLKGRVPLGSKSTQGHPLVAEGHGALLKMPSRSTTLPVLLERYLKLHFHDKTVQKLSTADE